MLVVPCTAGPMSSLGSLAENWIEKKTFAKQEFSQRAFIISISDGGVVIESLSYMERASSVFDSIEFARLDDLVKGISLLDVLYNGVGEFIRFVEVVEVFAFRVGSDYIAEKGMGVCVS